MQEPILYSMQKSSHLSPHSTTINHFNRPRKDPSDKMNYILHSSSTCAQFRGGGGVIYYFFQFSKMDTLLPIRYIVCVPLQKIGKFCRRCTFYCTVLYINEHLKKIKSKMFKHSSLGPKMGKKIKSKMFKHSS